MADASALPPRLAGPRLLFHKLPALCASVPLTLSPFPTFLLFSVGVALWLVYGMKAGSRSIIVSNFVTLGLSLSILFFSSGLTANEGGELQP